MIHHSRRREFGGRIADHVPVADVRDKAIRAVQAV